MSAESGSLRIGEVARRTGVAVATLRAWERRYELLDPDRTEGGHRLYRESDVERVKAMSRLLEEGWSAAAAAREVLREPATVTQLRPISGGGEGDSEAAQTLVHRLDDAIDVFDGPSADVVVDDVLARLEVPRALDDVILPVLRRVGEGWQDDPRVIAREHFATNTLRPRLQRLLRATGSVAGRSLLAATPEAEEHDLGLLASAAVAAHAGWKVHFLGSRTPTAAIERGVAQLEPQLVLVGSVFRSHAEAFLADRPDFGAAGVVLGGPGFAPGDAIRLRHAVLHQGPLRELPSTLERAMTLRQVG